jgi:hypothetical protein
VRGAGQHDKQRVKIGHRRTDQRIFARQNVLNANISAVGIGTHYIVRARKRLVPVANDDKITRQRRDATVAEGALGAANHRLPGKRR